MYGNRMNIYFFIIRGNGNLEKNKICTLNMFKGLRLVINKFSLHSLLHTTWLNNHVLTLKRNTAKYYFCLKTQFFAYFPKN
jgi:hypothetical protein